jgi:Zn-dependent M28 family amino/carboxypeptidase
VGAHYDHIGYRDLETEEGGPNNGADDNGSGTVLLMEMARQFNFFVAQGGTGDRDRRSVLFAAFGAEEQGLLGSCHYVHQQPVVALAQTKAMMNFDMVGRLRNETLFISGGETSDAWNSLMANANEPELGLAISFSSCRGCTDHACFWQAGIPFTGFFTGFHDEYHAPGDDVELINFQGMVRIGDLAIRALNRLVVMPDSPTLSVSFSLAG